MPGWVKVSGVWREAPQPAAKVAGTWRTESPAGFVKVAGTWRQWHAGGDEPPPPGDVTLSPTSQSIPTSLAGSAWALFDTSPYLGDITDAYAVIGYQSGILGVVNLNVFGRPSGTFYRSIADIRQWSGRTISHQINAGVGQLNAGTATGYTLQRDSGNLIWSNFISSLRMRLTIAP